jgi:hypothetical protein
VPRCFPRLDQFEAPGTDLLGDFALTGLGPRLHLLQHAEQLREAVDNRGIVGQGLKNRLQLVLEVGQIGGGGFSSLHFRVGLELNVVYFIFAVMFFRWMFESARSRGLLVKME